ncbi:MAG: hypothetical protein FJW30_15385 [Acidobacteria bacterium]|nr:hypothetical protein [Acidobacteriota bacterium]
MTHLQIKPSFTERHFSVGTLAELWSYSEDTVTRMFAEVPGVLKIGTTGKRGHRQRITLRIPESIAARVYAEKTR